MENFKSLLNRSGIGMLILFLIFQFSCTDQIPTTSEEPVGISKDHIVILRLAHPNRLQRPFSAQKWIDETGGEIWVGDSLSGLSGLKFPANALSDSQFISFDWESEGLLQGDFSPAGLSFSQPVEIKLSYVEADLTGIEESELAIYHYNTQNSLWEPISNCMVDSTEKFVKGDIYHFSRYAIGDEQ
jgi:hypothetical protein